MHIVRKSLGLIVLYAAIIVGIFVLQFRSDSVVSEKIGTMHITMAVKKNNNNQIVLKNRLQILFNGISFFVNDQNPVKTEGIDQKTERNLTLLSWEKTGPLSCDFHFSDNVTLFFTLSDDTSKAHFIIKALFPEDVSSVSLTYGLADGATVAERSGTYLKIGSRKDMWELSAAEIDSDRLSLTADVDSALYARIEKAKTFAIEDIPDNKEASVSTYTDAINNFKSNLISAFIESIKNSGSTNITEQEVVSYIAAMAEKGRYNEGIAAVPQSFRRDVKRTYLSAPYFDSLAYLNQTLDQQMKAYAGLISNATSSNLNSVFTVRNIADYMYLYPGAAAVIKLLEKVNSISTESMTLEEAAGILHVYVELLSKNNTLAEKLQPVTAVCINRIISACAMDGNSITISEGGTFLPVPQALKVGDSLLQFGKASGNTAYVRAGYMILNSYLAGNASFGLQVLADLYPVIVHDNPYYPHCQILSFNGDQPVWAWTCAKNIRYSGSTSGTVTVSMDFPQSYTHYVILKGIQQFKTIYIYDMIFHSDPRFESYNSSGFIYQSATNTLLLKSRHKAQTEVIRLVYSASGKDAEYNNAFTETDATTGAPVKAAPVTNEVLRDSRMPSVDDAAGSD
jgi:hypothetical protein